MLFNLHNGQVRFSSMDTGSKPIFRKKMMVGSLSIKKVIGLQGNIEHNGGYQSDKLGNINVTIPTHLDTMIGHGWPIYNGDFRTYPVPKESLLYPNNNLDSPYWRRILESKNMTGGNHNG